MSSAVPIRTVTISQIHIGERVRKSLGDLLPLASSLQQVGLMQPVVLDEDLKLLAGERRIGAAKLIGWDSIKAVIVSGEAKLAAEAKEENSRLMESDENTCRKGYTTSEKVLVGSKLEGKIAAQVREQQLEKLRITRMNNALPKRLAIRDRLASGAKCQAIVTGLGVSYSTVSKVRKAMNCGDESLFEPLHQSGAEMRPTGRESKTLHQVAQLVGMSETGYRLAKEIVKHGSETLIRALDEKLLAVDAIAFLAANYAVSDLSRYACLSNDNLKRQLNALLKDLQLVQQAHEMKEAGILPEPEKSRTPAENPAGPIAQGLHEQQALEPTPPGHKQAQQKSPSVSELFGTEINEHEIAVAQQAIETFRLQEAPEPEDYQVPIATQVTTMREAAGDTKRDRIGFVHDLAGELVERDPELATALAEALAERLG